MPKDCERRKKIYPFFLNAPLCTDIKHSKGGGVIRKALKFISFLLLFQSLFFIYNYAKAENEKKSFKSIIASAKTKFAQIKNKNSIRVPGFAQMNLIADQEKQTVKLHNPRKNSCYFKISIILEDGTVIWTSELIAPGEEIKNISLTKTIPEGTYNNVTVKYDCFALNKKASLNNAKIKIKLIVNKNGEG